MAARRGGIFLKSDERILGSSEFVEQVLRAAEERVEKKSSFLAEAFDLEGVAKRVAELLKIEPSEVWQHGKRPTRVEARSLLCHWATHELGLTTTEVAVRLGITQSAVSRAAVRGESLAADKAWQLKE